ncbi:MAG TPA: ABC transporter permease [Gemmatimonadaceae bacterium]|jgi:putative ABC transport system permease protein
MEISRTSFRSAFLSDLRFAARSLRKTPTFTAAAVVALMLGIGATTAILSVVNAVLLRPLPYANANQLVVVLHDGRNPVAPANFNDWRLQTRSFSAMGAAEAWTPDATGGDNPEAIAALHVTPGMFPMLGVAPLIGRAFTADEDRQGNDHVLVLGYGLWQRRFGGDRNVLGKTLALNGETYTIVGVMPKTFQFAPFWVTRAEMWAPLSLTTRLASRDGQSLRVFARLRDGVSLDQSRADVGAVTAILERQFPGTNRNVVVTPLKEMVVGSIETPLLVLFVAVAFVLLIACANVAHMLLARATSRRAELAVRTALGASRGRIVAQLLTESALLATVGGVLGIGVAFFGVRALVAASPSIIPRVASVTIDARVLMITLAITALTAVMFGLVPALRAARVDLVSPLRAADRSGNAADRGRLRSVLVASEFSLALVLLIAAGLMIRTFIALRHVDGGFDPRGVMTMTVSTSGTPAADSSRHAAFYADALTRVRATPGITAASYINHLPLGGDVWGFRFLIEGQPIPRPGERPRATYRVVFPQYFSAMHIPLLQGRDVAETDRLDAPPVVVVNEYLARTHWPNQSAIGKRISVGDSTWITVVGVVKNAVQDNWSAPPTEEIYLPFAQSPSYVRGTGASRSMALVARTSCDAESCDASLIAPRLRDAIHSIEPHAPISSVTTMSDLVDSATAESRFYVTLLGAFSAIAMILAAVGIYGVMSYAVSRRSREIGIRIALGADPMLVLRGVVREGLTLATCGAAVGVVLSLVLARAMRGVLFGVSPNDVATFATVTSSLLIVALAASVIPARRATRIDPLRALRE